MNYALFIHGLIARIVFRILHITALWVIIVLPMITGITCPHQHKHKSIIANKITVKHHKTPLFSEFNGFHTNVWNIIKSHRLSSPPSPSRVRTAKVLTLLPALVSLSLSLPQSIPNNSFTSQKTGQFQVKHKYIYNNTLLI
jgi:hypothetical protein